MNEPKKYLNRKEAARYLEVYSGLKISPATLAKYACEKTGPDYDYIGRWPVYTPAALDQWVASLRCPRSEKTKKPRKRRGLSRTPIMPNNIFEE